MLFSGLFHLPVWALIVTALILTHITIIGVTVYLHRHQAHRALELKPAISHFFRFWLWLTTGMVTKEWAAIHRKHHAKCETEEDPHSPQILGINKVLWTGVFLYVKETDNKATMERYGHGTPDDWIERTLYTPYNKCGIVLMLALDLALFGLVPGALIWGVQMLWIPFWAAGVINGIGHFWGYRNFQTGDASTNIVPWGVLIGGEELHNNHHAYATSAKLSNRWFEVDVGWGYICLLRWIGQARVKNVAVRVRLDRSKDAVDQATLQAIITHRYDVLARYARLLGSTWTNEIQHLRERITLAGLVDGPAAARVRRWLHQDVDQLAAAERAELTRLLGESPSLNTVYHMRQELVAIWTRTNATGEQLVSQLQDWCHRAESSEVAGLALFARNLRCYA